MGRTKEYLLNNYLIDDEYTEEILYLRARQWEEEQQLIAELTRTGELTVPETKKEETYENNSLDAFSL